MDIAKRFREVIGIRTLFVLLISMQVLQGCSAEIQGGDAVKAAANCAQVAGTSASSQRQLRAAWIATVTNIDWPSRPGLPVETQKQEFIRLLDGLRQMHMNAAIVQVKPTADAFYPSQYGPWSEYLTGVQGKDPGYNPLAFMIEESHRRNLEFHAWFNPFRVSLQSDIHKLVANHPALQHPDWVVSYGGKLYYNPGVPAARTFVIDSILEVVKNYDIDAVHLDDYFYPYRVANEDFPDEATYEQYGAAHFPNKDDWRRDNINQFVHDLESAIKRTKSYVKFGISPFGVWRNKSVDPTGSDTSAGQTDYDDLYADTRTWMRKGWLDYIAPQIYWNFGNPAAAYEKLVNWWAQEVRAQRVQLYIGQAAYKITSWKDANELPKQLQFNLNMHEVHGSIFFSIKELMANPDGIRDRLSNDIYKLPALIPTMPWLAGKVPHEVEHLSGQQAGSGIVLNWQDSANTNAAYYAIYRFESKAATQQCQGWGDGHLLDTARKMGNGAEQTFTDSTALKGKTYVYYVTALDRLHNESQANEGVTITVR
jgi:uncharacterized lipoprotein YddW (UPF0748 family)